MNKVVEFLTANPVQYNEIYPDAASRNVLTVFVIYEGSGEWFDLFRKPIERASWSFSRKIVCIAAAALKSVRPEPL